MGNQGLSVGHVIEIPRDRQEEKTGRFFEAQKRRSEIEAVLSSFHIIVTKTDLNMKGLF